MRQRPSPPTIREIEGLLAARGIEHVGVAPADVLHRAREALYDRKAAGLHAGMQFTYRNPDRSTDPQRAVEGARSIIVAALPYQTADEPVAPTGPGVVSARVARYAWADHYASLRSALREVALLLKAAGHRATVFADDNAVVDREVAHLAGIGWFGKNANILLPGAGSYFVLGSIITTAEYPPSEPIDDGCGTCRRCFDGCPTDAIVAPGVIDGNRCLAWLVQKPGTFPVEFREALGDRFYGCDDCQTSCPITVRLGHRHVTDTPDAELQAHVDVVDVLRADDDDLLEQYGRWYLADRDPRWWRRNALIVLGNVGTADDPDVVDTIEHYLAHDDDILREHAAWAAQRLGLDDIITAPSSPRHHHHATGTAAP